MPVESDFIEWITAQYERADYNLAASGIPALSAEEAARIEPVAAREPWREASAAIAVLHDVPAGEAISCIGASHALGLAFAALVRPGDEVLVEMPSYPSIAMSASLLGATVRTFARKPSEAFALDPDRICSALSPRTRVVAVSDLHNPSATRAGQDSIGVLASALAERGIFLLIDEIYLPFDRVGGPLRCRTWRAEAPNIVSVSSLSKAFGLGEHRIGWLFGPAAVVRKAQIALRASTGDLPPAWARFALGAIRHLPALASRSEQLIGGKAARVADWIASRPRLTWSGGGNSAGGALFCLVRVAEPGNLREAIEAGIERHDVVVAPGSFFGVPDSFRLGWALPESRLDEALRRLDGVLSDAGLI